MENLVIGKFKEKGFSGRVHKAFYNGNKVAVKIIDIERASNYEIEIMTKLDSKYIIKFIDYFEDDKHMYHIYEYGKMDLFKKIENENFSEFLAWKIIRRIAKGLEYLHSLNIGHLDIKSENILIDVNNKIKIIDFDHAYYFRKGEKIKVRKGTIYYLSPEAVKYDPYDFSVDIWALGIIYYEMIRKCSPFFAETKEEVYKLILDYEIDYSFFIFSNTMNRISKMLSYRSDRRPTATEIVLYF